MRKVPLGLAYLAGALKREGIPTDAYNLNVDDIHDIDFTKYDWVGIAVLTPFLKIVNDMCAIIRSQNPKVRIVVGGPHATYETEEIFSQIPEIDYAIVGEGEIPICRLVQAEEEHAQIPGVYYRSGNGSIVGTAPEIQPIDDIPFADQRVFDHGLLEKQNPFRAFLVSRGCPFKCHNCQPILNLVSNYRHRSVDNVMDEILWLNKTYGQTYFGFVDSVFPLRKTFFFDMYERIKRSGMEFSFHCNARTTTLDADIMRGFKDLNITRLAIGVESAVDRIVNGVLNKRINLDAVHGVFETAREIGIRTHAHFMIGIPGETIEDMRTTLEFAKTLPAASKEFNILTPWPGTQFYDVCIENGYLIEPDCARFNEKRGSVISTPQLSSRDVAVFYETIRKEMIDLGYVNSSDGSVYFSPGFEQYAN